MADPVPGNATATASTGDGDASVTYDPKTDPKRKAKGGDPGWKYGFWPVIGNRDLVQCSLCDRQMSGGITRLKEHLIGGYGDVLKCDNTTTAIAHELHEAILAKKKKKRALILDDDDEGHEVEDNEVIDVTEEFFAIKKQSDEKAAYLRGCFNDVMLRMVQDHDIRIKIDQQSLQYEYHRGDIFKNEMATLTMETKNPLDWWLTYGGRSIDLQRFAKRVVSLCASSSGCERNWSTFEFIHTKKRNRLEHKRLNDLVYISYNRKMAAGFQKRKEEGDKAFDPLIIEDFDWDNEWVDPNAKPPSGSDHSDLTWDQIDEAIGASRQLRGRNLPRACTRLASVVEEQGVPPLGELEEDEAEIILDDLDVADDFGEQEAAIEGEENNTSANNNLDLDQFTLDDL